MKLLHGDCLELMKQIPDGSVDLILTDPPYGTTNCKWDVVIPFEPMWEQLSRIIKPNGAIVLFGSEPFSSLLRCSNLKNYKYDWIWHKTSPTGYQNAKKQPLRDSENISVFYIKQCNYYPIKSTGHKRKVSKKENRDKCIQRRMEKHGDNYIYGKETGAPTYDSTERYPKTILTFKSDKQKTSLHPTQKPVALLEYLIKTYTLENEVVLDFTMGSGSTGVACVNTNRNLIGIEKDDRYFQIAKDRIEKSMNKQIELFS